jgi:hypothetical protein
LIISSASRLIDDASRRILVLSEHFVEVEPLAMKREHRVLRARIGEHAPRLRFEVVVGRERVVGGRVEQRLVGHGPPQQIRQAARHLVRRQRDLGRARAVVYALLDAIEERRRLQEGRERALERNVERAGGVEVGAELRVEEPVVCVELALLEGAAQRARRERGDELVPNRALIVAVGARLPRQQQIFARDGGGRDVEAGAAHLIDDQIRRGLVLDIAVEAPALPVIEHYRGQRDTAEEIAQCVIDLLLREPAQRRRRWPVRRRVTSPSAPASSTSAAAGAAAGTVAATRRAAAPDAADSAGAAFASCRVCSIACLAPWHDRVPEGEGA